MQSPFPGAHFFGLKNLLFSFFILLVAHTLQAQNIGGIGAMLAIDSAEGYTIPFIKNVLPNSPAAASLKEYLFILKVNDVSCKNKTIEEIVGLIRGEPGTHVKLSAADNKQGKDPKDYDLVRAAIQTEEPVITFNKECENGVKLLKRQGYIVVKTFNSDCGDFFFNFNTDTSLYHVRVLSMEEKTGAAYNQGFNLTARVFDSNDEAGAVKLFNVGTRDIGRSIMAQLGADIYFKRQSVGTISIQVFPLADVKACKAMYIVVYK